jgi:hypothetical protein
MKKVIGYFLLPAILMLALFTACNKDNNTEAVEEAVDEALYSIQERGGMGRYGCYELVFPLSITLPDNSTAEIESYDDFKQTLRTYFEANGGKPKGRPQIQFVFPISVVSQDGEVIPVTTQEELLALRAECRGTFDKHGSRGHGDRGLACFELTFPVTILFPDGTTATAADRQNLHELIRTWRKDNPGVRKRPQLTFPITVKMKDDGTLVTVNSREELRQLKEDCE